MINGERLWHRLMTLADIGKLETGGVTRLSYSVTERLAKDKVAVWMRDAGMTVREDAVGNLIGRYPGSQAALPAILMGSHVDSVFHGGNFDGPLGVLSAIEVVETLLEQGIQLKHPIEVVAFTDEEGARFSYGMIGSRAVAGTLSLEELTGHMDADGLTIAEAMAEAGYDPQLVSHARRSPQDVAVYLEVHIEQGQVLEAANQPVGIVTGLAGPLWLKVSVTGEVGHAGATPMNIRKDALAAAAEIMMLIEQTCAENGTTVGTVGQLTVHPGGINIIPGTAMFTLDLRDIDETVRDMVEERIVGGSRAICAKRHVQLEIEDLQRIEPVACADFVQASMTDACRALGFSGLRLPSGAGHDGMQFKHLCPIGMVFVRSKDGVSHDPAEWSSKEDCEAGADVLFETVLRLDQEL